MPDVGMPLPHRQTHTSTQEWQSFEIRMRRRRAERCILRAEVALDAGFEDDARTALDEARRLDWQSPDFDSLKARMEQRRAESQARLAARRRRVYAAAGIVALAIGSGTLFLYDDDPQAPVSVRSASVAEAAGVPSNAPVTPVPADAIGTNESAALPVSQPAASTGEPLTPAPRASDPPNVGGELEPNTREQRSMTEREPPAPDRGLSNAARAASEPPPLPSVAVPTTSAAATQPLPRSTGLLGRSDVRANTPPAERVPDLPPERVALPPEPRSAPAPAPAPPDDAGVRAALARYEAAYTNLDASAAQAVWPSVDARALERAFDGLESQRFSLGRCEISMNGPRAQASCRGSASWTPKVGGGGSRASARRWEFQLENAGGAWKITTVK